MLRSSTVAIFALSSLAPQGAAAADSRPNSVSVYYNEVPATMNAVPAPQTMLFRTSMTGSFELHFAPVEKYWLVVDGEAQLLYRTFGIGAKHASLHVKYDQASLT